MRLLLSIVLVASLAVNVVLLLQRDRPPAAPAAPTAPAAPAAAAPAAGHTTIAACEHALFESDRHLGDLRTSLWKALPAAEKFAASAPDPAVEPPVRGELARLFAAPELAGAAWNLECRGSVCELQIASDAEQRGVYMASLQHDEALRQHVRGFTFQAPRPTNDAVTGKSTQESRVFLELTAPGVDEQAGQTYLATLWTAFKASSAPADCAALLTPEEQRGARTLDVRLDVNLDGAGFHAFVGGELGASRAGRCIADRLAAAGAAAPTPAPDLHPQVVYSGLTLP